MERLNATIKILGEPQAQKRHRHFTMHKGVSPIVRTYDPSKSDKKDFLSLIQQSAPKEPVKAGVEVSVIACFSRPKSHYGTGKNKDVVKDHAPKEHISKPDGDNVLKFVTDAMKGVYYRDDSQISRMSIQKIYGVMPYVEISIREL